MVKDCIAEEYKLFSFPASDLANRIMALKKSGYTVDVHYSAGNVGSALIIAIKEEEEEEKLKTKVKAKATGKDVEDAAKSAPSSKKGTASEK